MEKVGLYRNRMGIILMMICAICLCMGQFMWKISDNYICIIAGFIVFVIGGGVMIIAYRFGRLSILQPINSTSYIISAILGVAFFDESITITKIIGILTIIIGVIILTRDGDSEDEKI